MKRILRYVYIPVLIICLAFNITASAFDGESEQMLDLGTQRIDIVEINFVEPVAGELPAMATVQDDADYYIDSDYSWWYCNTEARKLADDRPFFQGGAFEIVLKVIPKDGYEFHDQTELVVNGETTTPTSVSKTDLLYNSDEYFLRMVIPAAYICIVKPEVGEKAVIPTVPEDGGYAISEEHTYWKNLTTGKILNSGDTFQENNDYGLFATLYSQLEFQFTNQTQLFVHAENKNTHTYNSQQIEISNFADPFLEAVPLIYSFETSMKNHPDPVDREDGQDDVKTVENSNEHAPDTGDSGMEPFILLGALSTCILIITRKRFS